MDLKRRNCQLSDEEKSTGIGPISKGKKKKTPLFSEESEVYKKKKLTISKCFYFTFVSAAVWQNPRCRNNL